MFDRDPYELATEYLPWFAVECGFTPADVYGTGWFALVQLTLAADDYLDQQRTQRHDAEMANRQMRQAY